MKSYAYAPGSEFDLPTYSLFASPRVLDHRELERIAHPGRGEGRWGSAGWRPSVVDDRRPVHHRQEEAGYEASGSYRPIGHYRILTRLTALRVGLGAVMVAALLLLLFIPTADADRGPTPTVPHVVEPGDTLWSMAETYTPSAGDVRATVALIRTANGMSSGLLMVGDVIEIPIGDIPGWQSGTGGP